MKWKLNQEKNGRHFNGLFIYNAAPPPLVFFSSNKSVKLILTCIWIDIGYWFDDGVVYAQRFKRGCSNRIESSVMGVMI